MLIGIALYLRKRNLNAKKDPVRSGPAMRNPVTDEDAFNYTTQVAQRQFNNPNLQVREVQRGTLSGRNLEVFYAGQATPQRRTFTSQPAYRGVVNLNGADQFVYFLQGYGNDVRMGNFFQGQNIQFIVNTEAPVLRSETSTAVEPLGSMLQMVTLMTSVLKEKQSGNMLITNPNGMQVNMQFSADSVLFSTNGHGENLPAVVEKQNQGMH